MAGWDALTSRTPGSRAQRGEQEGEREVQPTQPRLAAASNTFITNIRGRHFFGPRFKLHWALFRTVSKLSPQHGTPFTISISRVGEMLRSVDMYCCNICYVLKRSQYATFRAHRRVKIFPALRFEPRR